MRRTGAAALAVAVSLLVAVPAAGADSPPVDLMPGATDAGYEYTGSITIAEDAVHAFMLDETGSWWRDSVLFTRSLDQSGTSVSLGRSTRVARASGFTLAEDAGTVAYLRRVDGRLVLRAPDGSESLPSWGGDAPIVENGPGSMSASWFAAGSVIYDRTDGTAYDLALLSTGIPAGALVEQVTWTTDVTETQAVWAVEGIDAGYDNRYSAVFTVPLGPSGPIGTATRLDEAPTTLDDSTDWRHLELAGISGDRAVWLYRALNPTTPAYDWLTTLRTVPLATPESARAERTWPDYLDVVVDGPQVIVGNRYAGMAVWVDPAAPATDLRTYAVPVTEGFKTAAGDLLATVDDYGTMWLRDLAGRTVTAQGAAPAAPPSFPDVTAGNPFQADVSWLAELGISRGYADGSYRPSAAVNRDAMAAFLYRLAGEPDVALPATSPFVDVPTSHPFFREIAWLSDAGISTGTVTPTGRYYKPSDPVSRDAMAAFLYRFAGQPTYPGMLDTPEFDDVAASHPFYAAINWMSWVGISRGTETAAGTFYQPATAVSREAMAAFMHRIHVGGFTHPWV